MTKTILFFIFFIFNIFITTNAFSSGDIPIKDTILLSKNKIDSGLVNNYSNFKLSIEMLSIIAPYQIISKSFNFSRNSSNNTNLANNISFHKADIYNHVEIDDTIRLEDFESTQIENSLDSIMNLWDVKQKDDATLTEIKTKEEIEEISDSIYIDRLMRINSLFPLKYNSVIKKYIELYTQKRRKQVEVMLGLSEYYFPLFEEALDMYNLPLELKYLPVIESALNPIARSRVGATGLWQFMYSTGKIYNLDVNSYVDERRDPLKSTYAAAKYLKELYGLYNDWTLVIAAYNCGPGIVNRAVKRSGGKTNYWQIYNYLPRETRGYVPAFIGATYVMNYYKSHGLNPEKFEKPFSNDTIMAKKQLHFQQISEVLNIPIEQIRNLNPQYTRDIIPAISRKYPLRLPNEYVDKFVELEDSIYKYKDSVYFDPKIKIDATPKFLKYAEYFPPSPKDKAKITYTVQPGDNLGFISSWFNVRINDIQYWNNLYWNRIIAGKKLIIYVPKEKFDFYNSFQTMSFEQKQALNGKPVQSANLNNNQFSSSFSSLDGNFIYHTIKKGDNLWSIAKKYEGVTDVEIMQLNNLSPVTIKNLKPGDVIKIKRKI